MAETGLVENSSESGSSSQSQGAAGGSSQSSSHRSTRQQSASESREVTKNTSTVIVTGGGEMDEESPLHDKRGVPTNDAHSNEGSELSSPPPDDGSSSSEQVYVDERSMGHPPPPQQYVISPANMVPVVERGGFISPGTHPPVLVMTAIQSEGFSSDREVNESPLQGVELRKQLVTQLEYYFSKENLSSDKYLSSQMDGDHYVPISIVAGFNQVKRLTSDVNLIRDAVLDSSVLQLDETGGKVRAVPEKRCVLILREIPKNTPEKDITALFASEKCPNYSSCEFADNDCWYVTFDSEEDTQKAHRYLREEVREFLGQPIRARIKGTTVQRSSGMPKKTRNPSFPIQSVYNGTPQIPPFYQQPPGTVVPWPPATSPGYFDAAAAASANSFVHFVGNPPQQAFTGPPNRFPSVPIYMSEGEPPAGGRGGARSVPPGGNPRPPHMDRGHSPRPIPIPISNGDVHTERDRVPERGGGTGGRGQREHYSSGGGGGGRYRNRGDEDQSKKIPPRLSKNRRSNGGTGESGDRGQLAPRQQPKPQHKFELAQSNFPPLPTSSDSGSPSTAAHPAVTQSQSHMTSSGVDEAGGSRSTLSDIVRGKHLKDSQGPPVSSLSLSATVASTVATSSQPPVASNANSSTTMPAPSLSSTTVSRTSTPSSATTPLSTSVTSTSTTVVEKRPPPSQAAATSAPNPPPASTVSPVTHSQHSLTPQSQPQNSSQPCPQQPSSSPGTGITTASPTAATATSSVSGVSSSNSSAVGSVAGTSTSNSSPAAQTVSTTITTSQIVSSGSQSVNTKPQVSQAPPLPPPLPASTTSTTASATPTPSSIAPATPISTPSVPISQPAAVSHHQPQTLMQTASQVVAMGIPAAPSASTSTTAAATSTAGGGAVGVVSGNQSQTASSRQPPPQPKAQRPDNKGFSREGRQYNNYNSYNNGANNKGGAARHSDRDYGQNRPNYRNPQVSKTDSRPFQSNGRGRYYNNRDRDNYSRRPGFNNRSQQLKPSPKTAKKNSAPQAPPPPPISTTPTPQSDTKSTQPVATPTSTEAAATDTPSSYSSSSSNTANNGASGAASSNSGPSKTEKLSYAQMAQKKAPVPPPLPKAGAATSSTTNTTATAGSQATTPPGTLSGSNVPSTAGAQQQQQSTSSKTASAPTSPQGQQSQLTSAGQVPNGSIPSGGASLVTKQSNSVKGGKTGLSGSSGQLSAPSHAALTASKSAPASPQKEKLAAEAVKSS